MIKVKKKVTELAFLLLLTLVTIYCRQAWAEESSLMPYDNTCLDATNVQNYMDMRTIGDRTFRDHIKTKL